MAVGNNGGFLAKWHGKVAARFGARDSMALSILGMVVADTVHR